ncbi:MAG: Wzz/FepE/Etk N-terminal domain-containing protein, partial [Actinomycetota bacterium]|nr:Wzz/FepE/Etk N-terminal domain-containing protein [Actinomycetota bacterium]
MTEPAAWDTWEGRGLRDYTAVIHRQRWTVAGVALLCVVLVVGALLLLPDRYESSVRVLAGPAARGPQDDATPVSDLVNVGTERQVLSSRAVGARVKRTIGYRGSIDDLLEQLSVEAPTDTEILELSFRAADPARARQGAQAFGEAYLGYRQRLAQAATEAQVRRLERKLLRRGRALDRAQAVLRRSGPSSDAARARGRVNLLESQVQSLQLELSLLRTPVPDAGTIVGTATPPEPDPLIPTLPGVVAALLLGLIAGLAAGFARDRLDD